MQEKVKILSAALIIFFLLLLGTLVYHNLEKWRYIDALYFSTTTLTTIGMGDFHPTSDVSKLFTIFYVLSGVSVVLYALSIIAEHYVRSRQHHIERGISETVKNLQKISGHIQRIPKPNLPSIYKDRKEKDKWVEIKVKK